MVGEVRAKLERLKASKKYPTGSEIYHKMIKVVDLDRSSSNEEYPNWIYLGFMQIWTKWTQKSRSRCLMTRSRYFRNRSRDLMRVQAYPTDRSEEFTKSPRRASHIETTSARSKGKWSRVNAKL